ncbi:MAG: M1 family aminopeptidase [Terriglobales bacterium]
MTKVWVRSRQIILLASWLLILWLLVPVAFAQSAKLGLDCPPTTSDLYARIRSVGLDPARVYHLREASIERPGFDLTFEDGTIAFTEDICGRVTGAFFVGDGEILVQPPNRIERASLALFTGTAILEEQFDSAYLRFNDDTAQLLKPYLSPAQWTNDAFKDWDDASRRLAEYDALRLFTDFSHFLPAPAVPAPVAEFPGMLHLHLIGRKLGAFEVFWDAAAPEPVWVGQFRNKENLGFFDTWTSFAPASTAESTPNSIRSDVSITSFLIDATVQPPIELHASTEVNVHARKGGQRALLFELSRHLKLDSVEADGRRFEFLQNPAIEGTQLDRRGNDLVAVVFPSYLVAGQDVKLRFRYAGDVLSDAGNGLLYVGARGAWYPSFGLSPASFDLKFRYPAEWTLLATGKRLAELSAGPPGDEGNSAQKTSHWISERPIPIAGFNLGKYVRAEAKAGKVVVEAYSSRGVERTFPKAPPTVITVPELPPSRSRHAPAAPIIVTPLPPSIVRDLQAVADKAAKSVTTFSQWFGPYPYGSLALTQMPGELSQGYPGLVFLSSLAFLDSQQEAQLNLAPATRTLNSQVVVHETAHQWWGDLVLWKTYHDQWIAEGLANYSSLLTLEQENPAQFREVMDTYRDDLLGKNKDGEWLREAGPVTLGQRLISSHFPNGYEAISYERGTWLFHMLRTMLRDSETATRHHGEKSNSDRPNPEEPFFIALRRAREQYAGKAISTRELIEAFEAELPRSLWYDNRPKLDWFVDSWINGTAIPRLETRNVRISQNAGKATISGIILQKEAPENLITAIPVFGESSSNTLVFLGEVLADGPETSFRFTAAGGINKVVLDPHQTILSAPK